MRRYILREKNNLYQLVAISKIFHIQKSLFADKHQFENIFFTLWAVLMRPFGALSVARSILIRLRRGCLPNERIKTVRNPD